ncbi:spermidine/putrescine ABC transporter permease, partial [Priestia megaterium]
MQTKSRNIYLVPYVLWILLFVVAPIVLVVYYSFFSIDNELTLENYKK